MCAELLYINCIQSQLHYKYHSIKGLDLGLCLGGA